MALSALGTGVPSTHSYGSVLLLGSDRGISILVHEFGTYSRCVWPGTAVILCCGDSGTWLAQRTITGRHCASDVTVSAAGSTAGLGWTRSLKISIGVAVVIAGLSLLAQHMYLAFVFGFCAINSLQALQAAGPRAWRRY